MALNDTQTKTLKSLALTDVILPQAALENIVETNELKNILSTGYVSIDSYSSLVQRVEEIETTGVSSYISDKDTLCASCQQLCSIVSGLNNKVNELSGIVQELCTLIQTSVQHNVAPFSNANMPTSTVAETLQTSNIQLMAAMPEKNEFAVVEDQLPAEEPIENQLEAPVVNQTKNITTVATKPKKKKHR